MCCYTRIWNYGGLTSDKQELIEGILKIAGFEQETASSWRRHFPLEEVDRSVLVSIENQVNIHLVPHIGDHTQHDHAIVAYPAAFAFQVANIIAEKLNARVQQMVLMGECKMEALHNDPPSMHRELADHSMQLPFKFENLCLGFRQAFLEGIQIKENNNG